MVAIHSSNTRPVVLTPPPRAAVEQDPFTFAVAGTDALHVGRKLGFAIGMVLCYGGGGGLV